MEFKEKLQLLRTHMKMSQEELAEKLNISRQSVTKWENGQSFPDIQNLIQLSEILKISLDRLIKDNDICNINILHHCRYPDQDIRMFLLRAKNSTYVTGDNKTASSRPASNDYRYSEDDYLYMDTYLGSQNFAGEEAVWIKNTPVWSMNYYGQVLKDPFNPEFLKEALSRVTPELPFRGPELYQKGDYLYQCQVQGDFDCFHGEELIYCKHEKIYTCIFHGRCIL